MLRLGNVSQEQKVDLIASRFNCPKIFPIGVGHRPFQHFPGDWCGGTFWTKIQLDHDLCSIRSYLHSGVIGSCFILLDRTLISLDRTLIPLDRTSVSLDSTLISLGGVLPMMAYTGRLRPKGVLFSGFRS